MAREETENLLRDLLLRALYERVGMPGSFEGEGKDARFRLEESSGGGTCRPEGSLDYTLPSEATLSHKSDILVSSADGKRIAIELVFLSSVTDHFKARSYDMLHLKQAYGSNLRGVMVYVHFPGAGIGIKAARAICYPYDEFHSAEPRKLTDFETWLRPLVDKLEAAIRA